VLLREDAAERPADPLRQFAISLAALEEAPRIATAGNHLAHLEAGLRHEKGLRHPKRATIGDQAQHPALDGEPATPRFRCGEPGDPLARQHDGPSCFAGENLNFVGGTEEAHGTQRLAGDLGCQIADVIRHLRHW
jgi:hypothetical protein